MKKAVCLFLFLILLIPAGGCGASGNPPSPSETPVSETPVPATARVSPSPEASGENAAPTGLSAEDSVGPDVLIDYADESIVVFHGWFGVFVYDIGKRTITSAVDLNRTVGDSDIQGSVSAAVSVSGDGSTVQISLRGPRDDMKDKGLDPDTAWYLDTQSGSLTRGSYQPLSSPFSNYAGNTNKGVLVSSNEIPFPDGAAYMAGDDMTLGGLRYVRGTLSLHVFEGYF